MKNIKKWTLLSILLLPALLCAKSVDEKGGILYVPVEFGKPIILPLKRTTIEIDVASGILQAKVSQEFYNDTKEVLEAKYIFPLPSQAAITNMEMVINDRVIKSEVKEKKEARKIYEQAKQQGHRTSLLEQRRDNIFTTQVANFSPGEQVTITFTYVEPLDYQKGSYSFTYPMVVGQRYIPFEIKTDENNMPYVEKSVTEEINPPLIPLGMKSEHMLSMMVRISGIPLQNVSSTTHAIHTEEYQDVTLVTFQDGTVLPDSDFELTMNLKESSDPEMTIITTEEEDFDYSLLTVFPPTKQKKGILSSHPKDVIFLIDTSGSMSGESIGQAKAGLLKCLQMLRSQDRFNIVRFDSDYSSFSPNLVSAGSNKISSAKRYVEFLQAGGGTEMQKALEYVLDLRVRKDALPMVIFLTDGCVGNENSLFQLLERKLGKHRLFTFAIGSAPNEYLMRKMGEKGHGDFRFIHSHEAIDHVMNDFFKTLQSPIMTDIQISWQPYSKDIATYPEVYPDVFSERPLQVYIRSPKGYTGNCKIEGKINERAVQYSYPLRIQKADHYSMIPQMYAKKKINDLMYDYIIQSQNHNLKKKIIEIALKYQLITQFTSRVAVEYERKIEKLPGGKLRTVDVPVELPKGWDEAEFYGTATDRYLHFAVGAFLIALFIIFTWVGRKWL